MSLYLLSKPSGFNVNTKKKYLPKLFRIARAAIAVKPRRLMWHQFVAAVTDECTSVAGAVSRLIRLIKEQDTT